MILQLRLVVWLILEELADAEWVGRREEADFNEIFGLYFCFRYTNTNILMLATVSLQVQTVKCSSAAQTTLNRDVTLHCTGYNQ
jgi:hypothetical protein